MTAAFKMLTNVFRAKSLHHLHHVQLMSDQLELPSPPKKIWFLLYWGFCVYSNLAEGSWMSDDITFQRTYWIDGGSIIRVHHSYHTGPPQEQISSAAYATTASLVTSSLLHNLPPLSSHPHFSTLPLSSSLSPFASPLVVTCDQTMVYDFR